MTGTNPRDEGLKPRSRRTWNSGFQVQLCSRYSKPHRYATLPGVRTETSKHKRLWLFNAMIFLAELGEVKFGSNITIIYVGLLGYYQNIHIYIFGLFACFCFLFDCFFSIQYPSKRLKNEVQFFGNLHDVALKGVTGNVRSLNWECRMVDTFF